MAEHEDTIQNKITEENHRQKTIVKTTEHQWSVEPLQAVYPVSLASPKDRRKQWRKNSEETVTKYFLSCLNIWNIDIIYYIHKISTKNVR